MVSQKICRQDQRKGNIPRICTSIERRHKALDKIANFNATNKLDEYVNSMKDLVATLRVPIIDLHV